MACLALAILVAGCVSPAPSAPTSASSEEVPAAPTVLHEIVCRTVDPSGEALLDGACRFRFPGVDETVAVDADGAARLEVGEGLTGQVTGAAQGRLNASAALTVDGPKAVRLVLVRETQATQPAPKAGNGPQPVAPEPAAVPIESRRWLPPVTVVQSGTGSEPQVVIADDGTVYYGPADDLYRSIDGGQSFTLVTPSLAESPPTFGSDTAVQVAPDGSVWWARYWAYAGTTVGCTSTDRGDSWTCDNTAIPAVTDRMWIAGKSASVGIVQTNEGLYQHVWAQTTTGSVKYTPFATSGNLLAVRNGNIVYDQANDAFWQVESIGTTQRLLRLDGALGLVPSRDTGVPNSYALPWLAVSNGTLWMTGEKGDGAGGQRSVVAARSTDTGATWQTFPIRSEALSVTFSYIAARGSRAALVYYGSDKAGDSTSNGGTWSLYVSETSNALDAEPVWVETKVVDGIHQGNLCIGLSCESSGNDPEARFAGDLIGCALAPDGSVLAAYVQDTGPGAEARAVRQSAT